MYCCPCVRLAKNVRRRVQPVYRRRMPHGFPVRKCAPRPSGAGNRRTELEDPSRVAVPKCAAAASSRRWRRGWTGGQGMAIAWADEAGTGARMTAAAAMTARRRRQRVRRTSSGSDRGRRVGWRRQATTRPASARRRRLRGAPALCALRTEGCRCAERGRTELQADLNRRIVELREVEAFPLDAHHPAAFR